MYQSTPLATVINSITISFRANCHLPAGSIVTITGFVGNFPEVRDNEVALLSEDSAEGGFDTPKWTLSSGTIELTVSSGGYISNSGFTTVSLSFRNKNALSNTSLGVTVEGSVKVACTASQNGERGFEHSLWGEFAILTTVGRGGGGKRRFDHFSRGIFCDSDA